MPNRYSISESRATWTALPALLCLLLLQGAPLFAGQTLTPFQQRPTAPGFTLTDSQGKQVSLEEFQGRPLVINFWASWCPPCRREMPSIERGAKWLARFDARFITINMGERPEAVTGYLEESGFSLPVLLDRDIEVSTRWGVSGLPVTFVIDPLGRLAYVAEGPREWDDPALLVPVRALGADQE